jgi:hypothetical protein
MEGAGWISLKFERERGTAFSHLINTNFDLVGSAH